MNIGLILAGGTGSRMGQDIPKQFIHVNNIPIIIYTLRAFQEHPEIDRIQVVCVDGWKAILQGYALQFNINKMAGISIGGDTRFFSTRKGMEDLDNLSDDDVIIVHDAVRPMVSAEAISDTIRVCKKYGNSMTILDCADTMYMKSAEFCTEETIERSNIVRGQTPEAVNAYHMREMYREADKKNIQLDSISALQSVLGKKVYFAQGNERNIKLTRTEDIDLFKALLKTTRDEWLK